MGDDEDARLESYPKFTSRASNVAPAGTLHLKRLLAIFMCTYIVIERERDVKLRGAVPSCRMVQRDRHNKTLQSLFRWTYDNYSLPPLQSLLSLCPVFLNNI